MNIRKTASGQYEYGEILPLLPPSCGLRAHATAVPSTTRYGSAIHMFGLLRDGATSSVRRRCQYPRHRDVSSCGTQKPRTAVFSIKVTLLHRFEKLPPGFLRNTTAEGFSSSGIGSRNRDGHACPGTFAN